MFGASFASVIVVSSEGWEHSAACRIGQAAGEKPKSPSCCNVRSRDLRSRSPAKVRIRGRPARANATRGSHGGNSREISGSAARENNLRSPGDNHAGWDAASDPGMVRLHEWKDPDKLRERSCEDTQYVGRRSGGAVDPRSRKCVW